MGSVAASILKIRVSTMGEFLCIYRFLLQKKHREKVGARAPSKPKGTVDRESCQLALIRTMKRIKKPTASGVNSVIILCPKSEQGSLRI
jgi:hypothetical protein